MSFSAMQNSELGKKLDPANVKPPAPGKYGDYIEGWFAISEANRIFGFDGWSYEVVTISLTNSGTFEIEKNGRNGSWKEQQVRVGYMATVAVKAGGVVHADVGHGQGFAKAQAEGDAHDSAVKEAVTDALKRALSRFGNPFGLALYDKTKANVGVDQPSPEELNRAREQKWIAERKGGVRMADNDSERILNTLLEAVDLAENRDDLGRFATDNQENIGYLIDPHYVRLKNAVVARQNANFGQRAAANG